uniref:Secreted protein n=1 Tax=Angiostrongylus cantonensis TaxID=6313 RepID=A0A0K0DL31_ANGCA
MLFPASAASTITAALLSLRSSLIACLHCFASSDVSSRLPAAHAIPRWRMSSRVSGDRRLLVTDLRTLSFHGANVKMFNEPIIFLVDVADNGTFPTAD